jgi:endonuclease/exonuclease/phosphatase family metal-dependent hydrolase
MYRILLAAGLLVGAYKAFAEPLRIVSYNVENLFHPGRDSVNTDTSFTPDGDKRWSFTRYHNKVENIARVLTDIGGWDGVDIVGLQEVENAAAVKQLCHTLRPGEYGFVHYDSPDLRGIDVALIYRTARIDTLRTRAIKVRAAKSASHPGELITRDILYVCVQADKTDTLHCLVCHLPSQRGGAAESEWKRRTAKEVLQHAVDSVLTENAQAKIIVMGDMNSTPEEDIAGLSNRMKSTKGQGTMYKGTHKHHGQWTCLDQFYTSPALDSLSKVRIYDAEWIMESDERYMGVKPKRTYNGFHYQNGFSDHLPIVLECLR